jgi:hypothetical protein
MLVLLSFILAAMAGVSIATTGVDVSQRTYASSFSCIKSYGYNFAIVRVYQSNGQCDPNGPYTIEDAWSGGMAHVDGYIFPCYSCGNPAKQVVFILFDQSRAVYRLTIILVIDG